MPFQFGDRVVIVNPGAAAVEHPAQQSHYGAGKCQEHLSLVPRLLRL
jgi:hypothetical protein